MKRGERENHIDTAMRLLSEKPEGYLLSRLS
jgi:hypothetical protein